MKQELPTDEKMYTIGEIGKMANISTKALRHYEKLGLIKPDYINKENGYRYYYESARLRVPIIKYLQFMNFSLSDIKKFFEEDDLSKIAQNFQRMIENTDIEIMNLVERKKIISDWSNLLVEGSTLKVIGKKAFSLKYLEKKELLKYKVNFDYDYEHGILDVEFANFVKKEKNKITGPVMMYFPNLKERLEYEEKSKLVKAYYIQETVKPIANEEKKFYFKEGIYACTYHFGDHKNLKEAYKNLLCWVETSGYQHKGKVIERYVIDYWTTIDKENFVTEILIPIKVEE